MVKKTGETKKKASSKQVWWIRSLLAAIFLGISYGFASWAIDSGNLLHYALSILFFYWGISNVFRATRSAFTR